ncbi:CNP1-like family protein [Rhodoferax sp.]|uniref:CNP1-like family protein n=1 Tax=Rhodoferax sp. TaxID=50421 RepID=UPI00284B1FB5|nr:CNP1-like family protein [Rhodoferax sp.]MDR3367999.1 CNP1-like family protein [Rhodoferax sp.]
MLDKRRIARWCAHTLLGTLALVLTMPIQAQVGPDDPDWKESNAPTPPAFNADKLLPLDMPPYVTLKVGIDPATLAITPDGIVRYVVVTRNTSGSVNAMYEGIRCATGEVKTYARASGTGVWSMVAEPTWRDFTDNLPSKHAWVFARQAACDGRATAASSTADIIKALKK